LESDPNYDPTMPHCVILYTPNIDAGRTSARCAAVADAMLTVRDEAGRQVFPTGGTRVLAYPAAHWAVADSQGDYAFRYINLRMGAGRSAQVQQQAGDACWRSSRRTWSDLRAGADRHHAADRRECRAGVRRKHSSLHPLFNK